MARDDQKAGRIAERKSATAANTDNLGPGTAGYTTTGAAYRGKEVADNQGVPGPAEPGFQGNTGLGYNNGNMAPSGYAPANPTPTQDWSQGSDKSMAKVPQGSKADVAEGGLDVEDAFTHLDRATNNRLAREATANRRREPHLTGLAFPTDHLLPPEGKDEADWENAPE
ncbi:MAG: hypothetical protein ACM3XM_17810 [Mycobacterium leprae]